MMGVRKLIACMAIIAMATAVSGQEIDPNGAPGGSGGNSIDFGGGIAHVNIGVPTTNVLNYTMSVWLSTDVIPGDEAFFIGQTDQGIHHGLRDNGDGFLHQAHWGNDHSGTTRVPEGPSSDPDSWVHAAFTYDFDGSIGSIYYNGVNDDGGGVAKGEPNRFGPENFLILGGRNGGEAGIDGQLDDVAFWDHVISDADILAIANGTLPTELADPAQLYWDFNDNNLSEDADGNVTVTGSAAGAGIWDVPANHAFTLPAPPPPPEPVLPFVAGEGNWNARFIKIDEAEVNGQINTTTEAREILAFADGGAAPADGAPVITEDVSDVRQVIDLAGNGGVTFVHNHPYPNGVNDASLNDFLVHVTTEEPIFFPEGTYSIAFGSDDGGELILTDDAGNPVNFDGSAVNEDGSVGSFNVNGDLDENDNILTFEAPRGNQTSCAQINVPAGGQSINIDGIFYERGGGDSLEIGVSDGPCRNMVNGFFFTLGSQHADDQFGLETPGNGGVTGAPCDLDGDGDCDQTDINMLYAGGADSAAIGTWLTQASEVDGTNTFLVGDANLDGTVNSGDLGLLLNNFNQSAGDNAAAGTWNGGDLNNDGTVNSGDLGLLLNNFGQPAASAAAVPEPNAVFLLGLGMLGLLARRRK